MADKAISELTAATAVGSTDLFVLEQGNVAKKLTGQILENWLVALANGHGGIQTIAKTATSGLVDTYTITFADETVSTFTVTNGNGISSVEKTAAVSPSLTDTYTITYTDGTEYSFTLTNGKGISSITKTSTSGLVDTYTITYNDTTTATFTVTNGKGISSIEDKWAVSSSNTQTPSTWYSAVQEMTSSNRYLWHYCVIAYNDGTTADTAKSVVGVYGDTGDDWYMWIKYATAEPTSDSDMISTPSNWIGIYSGTSSTAPTTYTSYEWFQYKGDKGDTGDGAAATSTEIVYQASASGTTVPTGTWLSTIPSVVQGQFLWTRSTVTWNDGTTATWYSVAYVAIDGQGSPGTATPLVDVSSGAVGTATSYSRQDHQHPLNVPSSGTPAMDGTASRGTASTYARSDHVHPQDTSRARAADVADAYSDSSTYALGDLCIYENVLYKCTTAITTAEAWNSSHWTAITIAEALSELKSAITSLGSDDIANDSSDVSGSTVTDAVDALKSAISDYDTIFSGSNTAGFHNSIYREKDITSYYTDSSLYDRITGTNGYSLFEDLYVGDYFTVTASGGAANTYVIVDFDYYYQTGSSACTTHHIVVMPKTNMNLTGYAPTLINTSNAGTTVSSQETVSAFKWNATMSAPNTNSTAGGYIGSRMRTVIMPCCNSLVSAVFGSHLIAPDVLYPTTFYSSSDGRATGWAWASGGSYDRYYCDLPNETQIYGEQVWSFGSSGESPAHEVGIDKRQFAYFRLTNTTTDQRADWWLRSVRSATSAAFVGNNGYAISYGSSNALGVRPRFLLS